MSLLKELNLSCISDLQSLLQTTVGRKQCRESSVLSHKRPFSWLATNLTRTARVAKWIEGNVCERGSEKNLGTAWPKTADRPVS